MSKYKLVPLEPTRKMLAAARGKQKFIADVCQDGTNSDVYQAMIAAAPEVTVDAKLVEQQVINSTLAKEAAEHLTNWLSLDLCECEGGHTCGRAEVTKTRDALLSDAQRAVVEQEPAAWITQNGLSRLQPNSERHTAIVHKIPGSGGYLPLYTLPQPAAVVAELVEALEYISKKSQDALKMTDNRAGRAKDEILCGYAEHIIQSCDAALAAYREQEVES